MFVVNELSYSIPIYSFPWKYFNFGCVMVRVISWSVEDRQNQLRYLKLEFAVFTSSCL